MKDETTGAGQGPAAAAEGPKGPGLSHAIFAAAVDTVALDELMGDLYRLRIERALLWGTIMGLILAAVVAAADR